MPEDNGSDGSSRRNVLKAAAATGAVASGLSAAVGSAAGAPGGSGGGNITSEPIQTTVSDGDRTGTFEGTLKVTQVKLPDQQQVSTQQTGDMLVSGVLQGIVEIGNLVRRISQRITDVLTNILDVIGGGSGECPILSLNLGPLNLDLLGLQVDLSEVNLDITAVAGPGNLLGNLLCAVAGLLDP